MKPLVFLDTETLGLGFTDPVWEVAVIRRDDEAESETRCQFQIQHAVPSEGDDQRPAYLRDQYLAQYVPDAALSRADAGNLLRTLLAPNSEGKAIIVGSAPDFDAYRIQHQLLAGEALWDHHLIDVPTLALGARGFSARTRRLRLPWNLDEACRAYGLDPVGPARHTAMVDAELVEDLFDRVTVGAYRIDR